MKVTLIPIIMLYITHVTANDTFLSPSGTHVLLSNFNFYDQLDFTLFNAFLKFSHLRSGKYVKNVFRTLVVITFVENPEKQHIPVDIINELLQENHRYYHQYILFNQFHVNAALLKYHECVVFVDGFNAIL